jgi:hypothetical protein
MWSNPRPKTRAENVIAAAKPHLTNGEFQGLEEFLMEWEDIFFWDNEDYGRTNKVYYRTDTGDARPVRQLRGEYPSQNKQKEMRCLTCNAAELSRNQTALGRSGPEEEWRTPFLRELQEN